MPSGITVSSGLLVGTQKPTDARYGPYASISAALTDLTPVYRYKGLTVGIEGAGGIITEYWFNDGLLDADFVEKIAEGVELQDLSVPDSAASVTVVISSLPPAVLPRIDSENGKPKYQANVPNAFYKVFWTGTSWKAYVEGTNYPQLGNFYSETLASGATWNTAFPWQATGWTNGGSVTRVGTYNAALAPSPLAAEASSGTSSKAARADHVHAIPRPVQTFSDLGTLNTYASSSSSYSGEICTISTADQTTAFRINFDKTVSEIGAPRVISGLAGAALQLSSLGRFHLYHLKDVSQNCLISLPTSPLVGDRLIINYASNASGDANEYTLTIPSGSTLSNAITLRERESVELSYIEGQWIPASLSVASDWNATDGISKIRNKPGNFSPASPYGQIQVTSGDNNSVGIYEFDSLVGGSPRYKMLLSNLVTQMVIEYRPGGTGSGWFLFDTDGTVQNTRYQALGSTAMSPELVPNWSAVNSAIPLVLSKINPPGKAGLVPAPAFGDETKFLRGDATYSAINVPQAVVQNSNRSSPGGNVVQFYREDDPTNNRVFLKDAAFDQEGEFPNYPISLKQALDGKASTSAFTGANGTTAGTAGLVPQPAATDNTKFLKGDGTWAAAPSAANVFTGTNGSTLGTSGLVPSPGLTAGAFLTSSATWVRLNPKASFGPVVINRFRGAQFGNSNYNASNAANRRVNFYDLTANNTLPKGNTVLGYNVGPGWPYPFNPLVHLGGNTGDEFTIAAYVRVRDAWNQGVFCQLRLRQRLDDSTARQVWVDSFGQGGTVIPTSDTSYNPTGALSQFGGGGLGTNRIYFASQNAFTLDTWLQFEFYFSAYGDGGPNNTNGAFIEDCEVICFKN